MSDELKRHILRAASRLRMVQAGFADEGEQQQQEYLGGELDELLKTMAPAEQQAFLAGLLEHFSPSMRAGVPGRAADGREQTACEAGPSLDSDALIDALTRALPTLSDVQKRSLIKALGQDVMHPSGSAAVASVEAAKRLRASLQTHGESELREDKVVELTSLLVEFVTRLEPLIAGVWGKVSPRSSIRPSRNFRKAAGGFLEEEGVPVTAVAQELTVLLQFVTAVVAGVGHAGDEFANRWSSLLSPEAISTVAEMKKGGLLKTREAKCWEQYCVQAEEHLSRDSIEKELREAIGRYAESVLKGLGRLGQ